MKQIPQILESYLLSLLLMLLCMGGSHVLWGNPFYGAIFFLSVSIVLALVPRRRDENKFRDIASYRVFTNMVFYSVLALNLGALMCICHLLFPFSEFVLRDYLFVGVWILLVALVERLTDYLLHHHKIALGFGTFLAGAVIWIVSDTLMLYADRRFFLILWTCFWGLGIALVSAGLRYFSEAFEAVGVLEGGRSREDLYRSNRAVQRTSAFFSSLIMLVVMLIWMLVLPVEEGGRLPLALRICQLQLPLILMIVAVFAALNQPLDAHSYEKLMIYLDGGEGDENVREALRNLLVRKYRVRYTVRILMGLTRPFLRMKVSGKEYLQKQEYPSVFVCNHGFINGPISAVVYLPTYFRPWIHDVMLDPERTTQEIAYSFPRAPRWIVRIAARLVCKVLNAYDPIPVVRGGSRDVLNTLELSLSALEDGENLLIFPELPNNRTRDGAESADPSELRSFYTGFAHIGKLYYEKTGRSLLFYPLYTDGEHREFRIGAPVRYDTTLTPRESKTLIAAELYRRMSQLAGLPGDR